MIVMIMMMMMLSMLCDRQTDRQDRTGKEKEIVHEE